MKLLVFVLCCIGSSMADSQAEASELSSSSNKLSSSKSTLNSIPSAPQKTTLIQQSQPVQQQQYIPQYVVQKQAAPQHQQPAAMFIIAQPSSQGHQSPLFQQAVQQLLSYYNNNPQAKYQLLQQQGGLPQGALPQHQPQPQAQPQVFHQQAFPSGALHVIPSPQLDAQNAQHLASAAQGVHQQLGNHQTPQATYVIPAQSLQTLSGINPGLLAQLTGQIPQAPQHVPVQFAPHQLLSHAQPFPAQLSSGHFLAQQIPQFAQQQHFVLPPQLAASLGLGQGHVQAQLPANFQAQFAGTAPAQAQFATKQVPQNLNGNDFAAQTEKSHQASSSSSYNPVYRTAFVKG